MAEKFLEDVTFSAEIEWGKAEKTKMIGNLSMHLFSLPITVEDRIFSFVSLLVVHDYASNKIQFLSLQLDRTIVEQCTFRKILLLKICEYHAET